MPDYSLVPVDYQPDFDDYSFPLITIRSRRMASLNKRKFNKLKPSRSNSQQRERVNRMPVRRL
jgi:hypothetical protein